MRWYSEQKARHRRSQERQGIERERGASARTATMPMVTPETVSETRIRPRRDKRSPTMPPANSMSSRGIENAVSTKPVAVLEWVMA